MLKFIEQEIVKLGMSLPDEVADFLSGGDTKVDGKKLDIKTKLLLLLSNIKPPLHSVSPAQARTIYTEIAEPCAIEYTPVYEISDISIPVSAGQVPVRIYYPHKTSTTLMPTMLYYHGGGFVIGGFATHDRMLRYLARRTGTAIVAVDYRLAPEYKFPTAFSDSFSVYLWLQQHGKDYSLDGQKVGLAGDSAGAGISVYVVRESIRKGLISPKFQLLFYPLLDISREYPSYKKYPNFGLTPEFIRYCKKHFCRSSEDAENSDYFPILEEKFSGFPPTQIQIAGFDPLKDEALSFESMLRRQNIDVNVIEYHSMVHGYVHFAGMVPTAKSAIEDAARFIANFAKPSTS